MSIEANAGEYDQRLTIWYNVPTVATDGQEVEGETFYIKRWAKVQPTGGSEKPIAQQLTADITHLVRMRSDVQTRRITPAYWLKLPDGTRLDIQRTYDLDLRKVELQMECIQRV